MNGAYDPESIPTTVPEPLDIELPSPSSFLILPGYATATFSILAVFSALGLSPYASLLRIESLSRLLAPALSNALPSLSNVDLGWSSLLPSCYYSSSLIVFS